MHKDHSHHLPHEAGKSSFDLIDEEEFFKALPLDGRKFVVDLGCGVGRYLFPMAKKAPEITFLGVDVWEEGVKQVNRVAIGDNIENVRAKPGHLQQLDFVEDLSADLTLMGTVLHDLYERGEEAEALSEVSRITVSGGILAIVEFYKKETEPGPPVEIRLSKEEVDEIVTPRGFKPVGVHSLGDCCYLALYEKS